MRYDCEFIIIQSIDEVNYTLREVFQIENDTFVLDFGNWNERYGLNISKMDVYSRRKDLNQTKLYMLISWVSQKNFYLLILYPISHP